MLTQLIQWTECMALCMPGKRSIIGALPLSSGWGFSTVYVKVVGCVGETALVSVTDQSRHCLSASLLLCRLEIFPLSLSFLIVKDQGILQDD